MTEWYKVGQLVNTHGVRGEVKILSTTDFPEKRFAKGSQLAIRQENGQYKTLTVASHRVHKQFHLLTFEGYTNINEVEGYKGLTLYVSADQQEELEIGEYYYHEIIGCTVVDEEGLKIGRVIEILSPGANDVWVVKREGQKDLLVPYIESVVREIDITNKTITIHLLEGLDV
ncbi:ribosome maturation factor RimM [Alkalicoccobacillus gibsonii]|jgi:16S rRNA processing protein RimM|uniref:Ribosome maturation factor RimM n=1 Tax=Alkalicoccobacillus gibsonii TaxID=79881 RepID=A0ABU9VLW4_9BACI|nr:ribosome maturation factor RimM [Alkalicoccobacillus gibsonii]MBM0065191.1 ribosome maturation factor RimM [Alkalicoccobacillus gibsonii]